MAKRITVGAAALLLLGGCSPGAPAGDAAEDAGDPVIGGEIVFATEAAATSLDPAINLAGNLRTVNLAIYDQLVNYDASGKIVPWLAEDIDVSDDLTTYTLGLRDGVTFHDGTPFNADAVLAALDHIRDPETKSPILSFYTGVTSLEAPDDHTVVFQLAAPDAGFLSTLAQIYIPSPTALEERGSDFGLAPVGTGPFKVASFTPGGDIVLERNDDYWRSDDGGQQLPYLDRLTFTPITDPDTRFQTLRAGDVDIIQTASTDTIKQALESGDLEVQQVSGSQSDVIYLDTDAPPFDNPLAREAVAAAIDRETINNLIYAGQVRESFSDIGDESLAVGVYYNPDAPYVTFDLERAKELVEELGGLTFTLDTFNSQPRQYLPLLEQMFEAAGMTVETRAEDLTAFVQRVYVGRDYNAALGRNGELADPSQLNYKYLSDGPQNITGYANDAVDEALLAGSATLDEQARKDAYFVVQEEIAKDNPVIKIVYMTYANIAQPTVHGLPTPEADALGQIKPGTLWVEQ